MTSEIELLNQDEVQLLVLASRALKQRKQTIARNAERYKTDEAFKEKSKQYMREYMRKRYETDPEFREKQKKRCAEAASAAYHGGVGVGITKYQTDNEYRERKKAQSRARYWKKKMEKQQQQAEQQEQTE